jgi:hypothetical protein
MSEKSPEQQSETASVTTMPKPAHVVKPREASAIGAGRKRVIPRSKSERVLSLLKQAKTHRSLSVIAREITGAQWSPTRCRMGNSESFQG